MVKKSVVRRVCPQMAYDLDTLSRTLTEKTGKKVSTAHASKLLVNLREERALVGIVKTDYVQFNRRKPRRTVESDLDEVLNTHNLLFV